MSGPVQHSPKKNELVEFKLNKPESQHSTDSELDYEIITEPASPVSEATHTDTHMNGEHSDTAGDPFKEKITTLLEGYVPKTRPTRKNSQPDPVLGAIELLSNELSGLRCDVTKATDKFAPVIAQVNHLQQATTATEVRVSDLEDRVRTLEASPPGRVESQRADLLELQLDEVQQSTLHTKLTLATSSINMVSLSRQNATNMVVDFLTDKLGITALELGGLNASLVKRDDNQSTRNEGRPYKPKFILDCGTISLRKRIRQLAREKKPTDCYINEYLTPRRH